MSENAFQEILEQLVSMLKLLLTSKVSFVLNPFSAFIKNPNNEEEENGLHILRLRWNNLV